MGVAFDLHIVDGKGAENPVADNLSRLENISYDPIPVNDSFPNEQLAAIKVTSRESPYLHLWHICIKKCPLKMINMKKNLSLTIYSQR